MSKFALIISGVVINVVVADTAITAGAALPGASAVLVDGLLVSPGDTYNGVSFTAHALTPVKFMDEGLFDVFGSKVTGAELTALGTLVNTDPQHRIMWDMFAGLRISTETYLSYLVLKGTISAARRDQFKV
jgi:hypothetical protein